MVNNLFIFWQKIDIASNPLSKNCSRIERQPAHSAKCRPGQVVHGRVFLHVPGQAEQLVSGAGVEQHVARLPEHQAELVVEVGQHDRLGRSFRQSHKIMNVFHCFKRLL